MDAVLHHRNWFFCLQFLVKLLPFRCATVVADPEWNPSIRLLTCNHFAEDSPMILSGSLMLCHHQPKKVLYAHLWPDRSTRGCMVPCTPNVKNSGKDTKSARQKTSIVNLKERQISSQRQLWSVVSECTRDRKGLHVMSFCKPSPMFCLMSPQTCHSMWDVQSLTSGKRQCYV